MYARPEIDAANAELWGSVRDQLRADGIDAPEMLDQNGVGYDYWENPNLLLSQTCGYPYRTRLRETVTLVGTPDYGLDGCPPGYYYSVILAQQSSPFQTIQDLQGATLAYNAKDSQSGYHGPMAHLAAYGIVAMPKMQTGSHVASAKAVTDGHCNIAAIDAVTWRHMSRFDEVTDALRVVARSQPVPGLPLITGFPKFVTPIQSALRAAMAKHPEAAGRLYLKGLEVLGPETYSTANFQLRPMHIG